MVAWFTASILLNKQRRPNEPVMAKLRSLVSIPRSAKIFDSVFSWLIVVFEPYRCTNAIKLEQLEPVKTKTKATAVKTKKN